MVGVSQRVALIDFVEANPELVLGRCSRSMEGRSVTKRLWAECAETLNKVSPNCVKTPDGWRQYFSDYKSKLLKRIKARNEEFSATGGCAPQLIHLSPLQDRLYNILGRAVGDPCLGVHYNPQKSPEWKFVPDVPELIEKTDTESDGNYSESEPPKPQKRKRQTNHTATDPLTGPVSDLNHTKPTNEGQRGKRPNEFDVFGENVSLQLQKMPIIHALEAQEKIFKILKEHRIKALKETQGKSSMRDNTFEDDD